MNNNQWKQQWQKACYTFVQQSMAFDSGHDINHIQRVVQNATQFCEQDNALLEVVLPAAWLHDCVTVSKGSSQRNKASALAADKAIEFLKTIGYPEKYFEQIHHAILAHSYSAKIEPKTLEAQIVQDADRIDAIGAIGIARCIAVGTQLELSLYSLTDPFCTSRKPNEKTYIIDHFYEKLFKLEKSMKTTAGKKEAKKRTDFMRQYLKQLEHEIATR